MAVTACYSGPSRFSPIRPHPEGITDETQPTVRLHRWDEIALEKVTEMISRKIVTGDREMVAQIYLKRGALVPMHSHESEQMTYVLQGALKFLVGGEEITSREGEVLHIPSWVEHQAEALDDTFELDCSARSARTGSITPTRTFTSKTGGRVAIAQMRHREAADCVWSGFLSRLDRPSPIARLNRRRTCGAAGSSSTSDSGI